MMFKIGIEVERISTSLLIVECEAASLEEAKRIALKGAREQARKARSVRDLFPGASPIDVHWEDGHFSINGLSDEIPQEQMEHYSADLTMCP